MRNDLRIEDVVIVSAVPEDRKCGVVGFAALTVHGSVRIDGLAVIRGEAGYRVRFPSRRAGSGRRHPYLRVGREARRQVEQKILDTLSQPVRRP